MNVFEDPRFGHQDHDVELQEIDFWLLSPSPLSWYLYNVTSTLLSFNPAYLFAIIQKHFSIILFFLYQEAESSRTLLKGVLPFQLSPPVLPPLPFYVVDHQLLFLVLSCLLLQRSRILSWHHTTLVSFTPSNKSFLDYSILFFEKNVQKAFHNRQTTFDPN